MHEYSNAEIANIFNVSVSAMASVIDYRGLKRTESENKSIHHRIMIEQNSTRTGESNPNWKGGISTDKYRYKKIAQKRHPKEHSARSKVHHAVRVGNITPQPCEVCGSDKVQAHHDDYDKPLEVRWLCRKHHRALHKELGTKNQ